MTGVMRRVSLLVLSFGLAGCHLVFPYSGADLSPDRPSDHPSPPDRATFEATRGDGPFADGERRDARVPDVHLSDKIKIKPDVIDKGPAKIDKKPDTFPFDKGPVKIDKGSPDVLVAKIDNGPPDVDKGPVKIDKGPPDVGAPDASAACAVGFDTQTPHVTTGELTPSWTHTSGKTATVLLVQLVVDGPAAPNTVTYNGTSMPWAYGMTQTGTLYYGVYATPLSSGGGTGTISVVLPQAGHMVAVSSSWINAAIAVGRETNTGVSTAPNVTSTAGMPAACLAVDLVATRNTTAALTASSDQTPIVSQLSNALQFASSRKVFSAKTSWATSWTAGNGRWVIVASALQPL
jgi:hypothetical protein